MNISHDNNADSNYNGFGQPEWDALYNLLDGINHRYTGSNGSDDLTTKPLKDFVGGGQAAVIIRFDFDEGGSPTLGDRAGKGFFYKKAFRDLYDSYANTDNPDDLMNDQFSKTRAHRDNPDKPVFSLDWALTIPSNVSVFTTDLRWWADAAMTPRLGPSIIPNVTKTMYPNIIGLDGVKTSDVLAVATAINTLVSGAS